MLLRAQTERAYQKSLIGSYEGVAFGHRLTTIRANLIYTNVFFKQTTSVISIQLADYVLIAGQDIGLIHTKQINKQYTCPARMHYSLACPVGTKVYLPLMLMQNYVAS